ncbi:hypothetical protein GCM10028771_30260 [Nocardioides marmoraquaticus]
MVPVREPLGLAKSGEGTQMNTKSRTVRGLLLAATVAIAVSAVPATSASADSEAKPSKAILKAIL